MNSRRSVSLEPAGFAASANRAAGRWIACVSDLTAAFTLWVALGGAGGRACGFGLALVAGRCCGGAEAVEVTTGRDVVAELTCEVDDVVELEAGVLVVDAVVVVARATGDGSGQSWAGALTGARSGPAPRATTGASISPNAPSTALTSTRANRGR